MSLKRSGAYRQAWLITLPALLFLGYEGVVVAHLGSLGNWNVLNDSAIVSGIIGLFFFVLIGFIANLFAILLPPAAFWYAYSLGRVPANIQDRAPLATFQPDSSLALRDGETLTLSSRRRLGQGENLLGFIIVFLLVLLSGEAFVVPLLPAASTYVQNLFAALTSATALPIPILSWLDWLAIAFPVICALAGIPLIVFSGAGGGEYRIVADDRGVTTRRARRGAHHVPWSDIALFLRQTDSPVATVQGNYVLWGRYNFLEFTIVRKAFGVRTTPNADEKVSSQQAGPYIFEGGYEQYRADANRLLATICARSNRPLRARAGRTQTSGTSPSRFLAMSIELEDVLTAPTTDLPWRPSAEALAAVPPKGSLESLIVLKPRLSWSRVIVGAFRGMIVSLVLFAACGGIFGILVYPPLRINPFLSDQTYQMTLLITGSFFTVILLVSNFLLAIARQRSRLPIIRTDDLGITKGTGRQTSTSLRWADIRAWAILPPPPGDRDGPTYFLFTEGDHFTWREPTDAQLAGRGIQGDRHLAYRERTAALHALIAARTALPLRELGLPKSANTLTA